MNVPTDITVDTRKTIPGTRRAMAAMFVQAVMGVFTAKIVQVQILEFARHALHAVVKMKYGSDVYMKRDTTTPTVIAFHGMLQ